MRLRLAVAACLLLTTIAQAAAQAPMPGPAYTFAEVKAPEQASQAGTTATFTFTAERVCTSAADYLPATTAKVDFWADDANLTVAGPGQVEFPEQVCAQMSRAAVSFPASVAIPAAAETGTHKLKAVLHPEPSGAVPRYANDATVDFLVGVVAAPEAKVAADGGGDVKASPGAAPVFLLGVLALAALAARRDD